MFRGSGAYSEKAGLVVRLPAIDVDVFDLFNQWLYQQPAPDNYAYQLTLRIGDEIRQLTLLESATLCVLADFLQCQSLALTCKTYARATLSTAAKPSCPDLDTVNYVYGNFEKGSRFRASVVKMFSEACDFKNLSPEVAVNYPPQFLWDVAVRKDTVIKQEREE